MAKIIWKIAGTADNIYWFSVVDEIFEENHVQLLNAILHAKLSKTNL